MTTPQKALQDVIALGAQCVPVIDNGDGREIWHNVGPGKKTNGDK